MSESDPASNQDVIYHHLTSTPWERPEDAAPELRELADKAAEVGARRARIINGALDMHAQISEFPPGYEVPPHKHSAHELMIVLEGSCAIHNGPTLSAGDIAEVPSATEYGFVAGPEGMRFVVVRPQASTTQLSQESSNA